MQLVTPAGTITFNDHTSANFMLLDAEDGVTGMTPEIRGSQRDRPLHGGTRVNKKLLGGLFPVLRGQFVHNDVANQETMRQQLIAAVHSILDVPGVLRWQPSNAGGEWRRCEIYANEKPDVSGGLFKAFQLSFIAEKPYLFSDDLHSQDSSYIAPGAGGGASFPITFPLTFASGSTSGTAVVTNVGGNESYPVVRIYGPLTGPIIVKNMASGDAVYLTSGLTIPTGQFLDVDMWEETLYLNGDEDTPADQYLTPETSVFWALEGAAVTTVLVSGSLSDPLSTHATVLWRDSYA